jgi:signal transduction histidine kinase/ligand-binding sensor domain-containing protein
MHGSLFPAVGLLSILVFPALAGPPASNWSVHVWQSDDGLPNNNVTGLAQTSDGYLWIANPGHLARFDGVNFETFPSIRFAGLDQKPVSLLRSRSGGLWVAMDHGGLALLNSDSTRVFTNELPNLIAWTLTEGDDGALWAICGGSTVCRFKDGQVKKFTGQNGLPAAPRGGCSMAKDGKGRLWFATAGELDRYQNGRFEAILRVTEPDTPIRLATARDGGLWICTGFRILKYDGDKAVELGGVQPEEPGTEPTVLLEDRRGGVWIGTTSSGVFRWSTNGSEHLETSHGAISSLMEDREGHVWVGTGGGGLDRMQPRAIKVEDAGAGQPMSAIQSVCAQGEGTLWATTEAGLLLRRGGEGWSIVSTNSNWPGVKATCVAADRAGNVWIGTRDHKLLCWKEGRFTSFGVPDGFPSRVIHALLVDATDDLWIAGEVPESLERLHAGHLQTFKLPPDIRIIRAMAEDAAGSVWLGTTKGILLRVSGAQVIDETARISGSPLSIRCLSATADGSLWIGYVGGGVGRLKDGHFARISSAEGLYDDIISQIVADAQGWLWFGCDHGIFKVKRQELEDIAEGRAARVRSIHYGRDDGLPSLQANFGDSPGSIRTDDGRLWIPMRTGVAVVDAGELRQDADPPPVLLTRLTVDDRTVAYYGGVAPVQDAMDLGQPQSKFRLEPGHHRLQFDFSALTFGAAENVHFRYRLEGIDENWVEAGTQRSASYSRLPAGDYRFQVKACNADGVWNESAAMLGFSVAPFLWQTWWFRFSALAFFTAGVIGAGRYVWFRRLRSRLRELEQKAALDRERARIARDIHDDLGGSLTQTLLLVNLTGKHQADPVRVSGYLKQISSGVRQVVQSLDEIVWAANPGNDHLPAFVDYVGQFAAEFLQAANIRCWFDLPDAPPDRPLAPEVRHNLFLALKESLNNVVRHADASEVRLRLTATDELLSVIVEDNGRGFAKAPDSTGADGLHNMRQRLSAMGGRCVIESTPGAGTRVCLFLPWPPRGEVAVASIAPNRGNA